MEKKKGANVGAKWSNKICHSNLYFYCCGQIIGWGCGGQRPRYSSRVFLEFHYLRVNINTLLCNPNLIYNESLLFCSYGHR